MAGLFLHLFRAPLLAAALVWGGNVAGADLVPAPPFQDRAVLQQGKPVPVWGRAKSGETVAVEFRGQKKTAVADSDGRWRVDLEPLNASAEPAEMVIAAGVETVRVRDVLVGEVWICSGQSNMAWTVKNSKDPVEETAAARYPLIRHFKAALTAAEAPQDFVKGEWEVCSPETVGNFSAVGYYFGRELFRKLNVPIGLINISYGGTPVESWMSDKALRSDPAFAPVFARWKETQNRYPAQYQRYLQRLEEWKVEKADAAKAGKPFTRRAPLKPSGGEVDRFTPSSLYHAMLHPFLPVAARGVIWFQGEANIQRSQEYAALFAAMIRQWRQEFGQGDLPFYFVQLANQARESDTTRVLFAFLREAQTQVLSLPGTGMAVSADIGDAYDSHFKNKQEVGRRLALIALHQLYDQSGEFSGPMARKFTVEGGALRVAFSHAEGLRLSGPGGFELAGADQVYHPAVARVDREALLVESQAVPVPVTVRYAWQNNPAMTLFNGAGLPAPPFRNDHLPVPQPSAPAEAGDE